MSENTSSTDGMIVRGLQILREDLPEIAEEPKIEGHVLRLFSQRADVNSPETMLDELMYEGVLYEPDEGYYRAPNTIDSLLESQRSGSESGDIGGVESIEGSSLVSSEGNFQNLMVALLESSGMECLEEYSVGATRRAMDLYLPETDTAIELKTESSQRKGIGQALDYLQGCSESLLIVPAPYADERVAESCENTGVEYGVLVADGFEYTLQVRETPTFASETDTEELVFGVEELEEP